MKTAEEILQSHYVKDKGLNNPEYVIEAMKEYAREACEQQRHLCYRAYMDQPIATGADKFNAISNEMEAILNAPLPTLP